jgi:ClpP class serine protease
MRYRHIAARLFNTPLLAHAGKTAAILQAIGGRIVSAPVEIDGAEPIAHVAFEHGRPSMGRLGDPLGREFATYEIDPLEVIDGVAVIPVEGSLVHKGKWVGSYSGDTSYEGLQTLIGRARARDDVQGVIFEVDSFGGEVAGAYDTAGLIVDLSAEKPTISILTDHALSAGYLLASAARQIIVPESGMAGSIGVVAVHVDYSAAAEKSGVKLTVLSAGEHKTDGHPYAALPSDVADRWRSELQTERERFAAAVARQRGERMSFDAAMATEADTFTGDQAVETGLADAVMRPSEAFDAFLAEVHRVSRPSFPKGSPMGTKTGLAAVKAAVLEDGQRPNAEPVTVHSGLTEQDVQARVEEALTAHNQRTEAILSADEAKGREDLAKFLAFSTTLSVDAAKAALAKSPKPAEPAANPFEAAMRSGGNPQIGPDAPNAPGGEPVAQAGLLTARMSKSFASRAKQ